MAEWKCDNCGIKKKSFFASFGDLFFDYPKGSSLRDYKIKRKLFCSRECFNEYKTQYLSHMKKMSSLNGVWKLRMYLIFRNPVVLVAIIMSLAIIGIMIYLLIKYSSPDYSFAFSPIFIILPVILFFLWYLNQLVTHPWIFPTAY